MVRRHIGFCHGANPIILAARLSARGMKKSPSKEVRGRGAPIGALVVCRALFGHGAASIGVETARRSALHGGALSASGRAFRGTAENPPLRQPAPGTDFVPGGTPKPPGARVRTPPPDAAPAGSRGFPPGGSHWNKAPFSAPASGSSRLHERLMRAAPRRTRRGKDKGDLGGGDKFIFGSDVGWVERSEFREGDRFRFAKSNLGLPVLEELSIKDLNRIARVEVV